jgi:hypothetical protein
LIESNRDKALEFAIRTAGMQAQAPNDGAILATAQAYLAFLEAAVPNVSETQVAPKASRGKKAAAASTPAEPSTAATAGQTAINPTPAATASVSNDMFGEEAASPKDSATAAQAAAATPAGNATQSKKDAPAASGKTEKAKAPTLDEVRAAMVDVQTKCGGKAAAQGLLIEFTTDKKPLYSALPEEKYGALIAAYKELVAKAK